MSRSKAGGRNGRRQNALKYLENSLAKWNTHNEDFVSKNPKKANTRSHEAEKARLEREIESVKQHLAGNFKKKQCKYNRQLEKTQLIIWPAQKYYQSESFSAVKD